jgi:transposase InsO family protein
MGNNDMSRRANCWDNAVMENFFGLLKEEYLKRFKKPPLRNGVAHL